MADEEAKGRWSEDGLMAWLETADNSVFARLEVEHWYGEHSREAEAAWVVSWLDHTTECPSMLRALVEVPALTADTHERREYLEQSAVAAMSAPPATPPPFELPPPSPQTADEWARHLDLQTRCFDRALSELQTATKEMGASAELSRYRTLSETLNWAYALGRSLNLLWRSLAFDTREALSRKTDARAAEAAENNAAGPLPFNLETDYAFVGYMKRLRDRQPYRHWSEVQLAGVFQQRFFHALAWVRGQLMHAATSAPMDMRHWRAGEEPRWKWRESALWARGRADDAGRRAYDRLLARHDVLGLLNHLPGIFVEAQRTITAARRREEAVRSEVEGPADQ